jgi:hypothetical protein
MVYVQRSRKATTGAKPLHDTHDLPGASLGALPLPRAGCSDVRVGQVFARSCGIPGTQTGQPARSTA